MAWAREHSIPFEDLECTLAAADTSGAHIAAVGEPSSDLHKDVDRLESSDVAEQCRCALGEVGMK